MNCVVTKKDLLLNFSLCFVIGGGDAANTQRQGYS